MKKMFCLTIINLSMEQAWEQLESQGVELAYGDEEESHTTIYAYAENDEIFHKFPFIKKISDYQLPDIDWDAQWEQHGHHFKDGFVNVDLDFLGLENDPLKLLAGPGFGDLSHPTTYLILELMSHYLNKQSVIDIGCGSGILGLVAAKLGSPHVYGIDIDREALHHSQKNTELNQFTHVCEYCLPEDFAPTINNNCLIVMNMISSEQKVAWTSLKALEKLEGFLLTSGIRKEEREAYLKQASDWNLSNLKEIEKDGWLAFAFKKQLLNQAKNFQ